VSKDSLYAKCADIGGIVFLTVVIPFVFIAGSMDLAGGAGLFPLCMSGLMLLCGAMSLHARLGKRDASDGAPRTHFSVLRLLSLTLVLFLFIPLSETLGFYVTNFIYIVAGFLFLAGSVTGKYLIQAILLAGIFVLAEKLIFYDLLAVLTPAGMLL
jgi:hypothetical protein